MPKYRTPLGVSIIVCTNRPQFLDNILQNYYRQRYKVKELIIILNQDSMNMRLIQKRYRDMLMSEYTGYPSAYH